LAARSLVFAASLSFVISGCAWYAITPKPVLTDPDGQQSYANRLALNETRADTLHCDAGDCQDWFLIQVDRAGVLEIVVTIPNPETSGALRLAFHDTEIGAAQFTNWDDVPPLSLRTPVEPGAYFTYVEGDDAEVAFEIRAKLWEPGTRPE
jgi:hypothetical protein